MTLPPQSHSHHRISTCHRHPSKPVTGFCAACLRERLAGIDPDTHQETPITHLAAELRRCKSYSSSSNHNASSSTSTATTTATTNTSEPRRKSCDVRGRNSLSDLFHIDDKRGVAGSNRKSKGVDLGLQLKEEEEICTDTKRVSNVEGKDRNFIDFEEEEEEEGEGEFKTMKEFIDLEWEKKRNGGGKDFRVFAGNFWEAASVFSKKIGKWQLKQKKKEEEKEKKNEGSGGLVKKEKSFLRKLRETQSEVGEYGLCGRRSCDTDPRLSVDVARLSVDDSRYSFDEARASWDGFLIGKTYPRLTPLVSVVEDVKLRSGNGDEGVKEDVGLKKNEGESCPGDTVQTRDYYSDRRARRRSFDRSSSTNRRMSLGDDELKSISNAKVSPETVGLFHGAKLLVTEKELRDSNWYSLKDYQKESADSVSKDVEYVGGGVSKKGFKFKKSQRWRGLWNIWSMMQRRSESKCIDEGSGIGENVANEPISESWQKVREVSNGETNGSVSQKLIRSYTISTKDSCRMACSSTSGVEAMENGIKRREDQLVLHQNRSARYSPNNLDNGLLRFYLTPLRNYGRSKPGMSRLKYSQSQARNVL